MAKLILLGMIILSVAMPMARASARKANSTDSLRNWMIS